MSDDLANGAKIVCGVLLAAGAMFGAKSLIERSGKRPNPMRPSRYYVEYEDETKERSLIARGIDPEDVEPATRMSERDFDDLRAARRFARGLRGWWEIVERAHLIDVTPPEEGSGMLWDWKARTVGKRS